MLQDAEERAALVAEITDIVNAAVVKNTTAAVIAELWDNPTPPLAWYAPKHAAAYVDMTVTGLAQLRRDGKGPEYKRPSWRFVRYLRADLDAWLDAHPERRDPATRRVPGDPTPGGGS